MSDENRHIELPVVLCEKVEAMWVGKHFASLQDLLIYVMQELASQDAAYMDEEEERIVEQRLRDLGYL